MNKPLSLSRILSICKDEWQDFKWKIINYELTCIDGEKNKFSIILAPAKVCPDYINVDIFELKSNEWNFVNSEDLLVKDKKPVTERQLKKHLRQIRYKYF